MRFLVDECTGPRVAQWLREAGHDVFSVYEQARGLDDETVIQQADRESRILITNDTLPPPRSPDRPPPKLNPKRSPLHPISLTYLVLCR